MHWDRFLVAEIEIDIPESVRHSQRFSGWKLKLTLSLKIFLLHTV